MARRGYLGGADMARTFNALRANDLIWNYVGSNWLMGEDPRVRHSRVERRQHTHAGDHAQLLPAFLLRRQRVCAASWNWRERGSVRRGSKPTCTYWRPRLTTSRRGARASSSSTLFSSSAVRFVLTSSGHIAGIVNPPSPKSAHWTDGEPTSDPEHWLATATRRDGSWWEDWVAWIATRAGSRIVPPSLGSEMHPPLGDAPGEYVHEK